MGDIALAFSAAVSKLLKATLKKGSDGSPVGAEAARQGPVSVVAAVD